MGNENITVLLIFCFPHKASLASCAGQGGYVHALWRSYPVGLPNSVSPYGRGANGEVNRRQFPLIIFPTNPPLAKRSIHPAVSSARYAGGLDERDRDYLFKILSLPLHFFF